MTDLKTSKDEVRCERCGGLARRQLMGTWICDACQSSVMPPMPPLSDEELRFADDDFDAAYSKPQDTQVLVLRLVREIKRLRSVPETTPDCHGLDNARQVFFYEQDFYVLSNFSAFMIQCNGIMFPTSEHAYHWDKFPDDPLKQRSIQVASSAHDAFKMAERWKQYRRPDWDEVKVGIMRGILRLKVGQHEYVRRKLLATGDRELIENSWRDDFWGWGENHTGKNMLGKLWTEIRAECRAAVKTTPSYDGATPVRASTAEVVLPNTAESTASPVHPLAELVREAIDHMGAWEYDDLRNWRQRAESALGESES